MIQKKHSIGVRKRFIMMMRQVIAQEISGVSTETEFAKRVGILQQNMSKISAGERMPTVEVLCNACIQFNANPAWLLANEGEMFIEKKYNLTNIKEPGQKKAS